MTPNARTSLPILLATLLLLGYGGVGAGPVRAEDPKPAAPAAPADLAKELAAGLKHLHLADGLQADQVTLFPLYVLAEPQTLEIGALTDGSPMLATEIEGKTDAARVRVANTGPKMGLLLGGTVLAGGKRDRVVTHDVLIPAGDAREVDVVPASMSGETPKVTPDLQVLSFLAPPYVREGALSGTTKGFVSRFVSHFLDFRNPGDKRKSLAAIGDADALADYCLVCQRSMEAWPQRKGAGVVVGGLSVVRGRVQSVEVFATNDHVKAWFEPILRSLAFPAAAMELRAKKVGLTLPKGDEATLTAATAAAKETLAALGTAVFEPRKSAEGTLGQSFKVKLKDGSAGGAIALDGRLIHVAIFPDDPFDRALYAVPLEPLVGDDASDDEEDRKGSAELERRAALGVRLTEAEKRVLERLRAGGVRVR
jgi:hypothetical protein